MNYHNNTNTYNKNNKVSRCDTLRLSKEINEKYCNEVMIKITHMNIIKDDIRNYRPLNNEQLLQVETLTDTEKIELIKLYNTMFITLENVIV